LISPGKQFEDNPFVGIQSAGFGIRDCFWLDRLQVAGLESLENARMNI